MQTTYAIIFTFFILFTVALASTTATVNNVNTPQPTTSQEESCGNNDIVNSSFNRSSVLFEQILAQYYDQIDKDALPKSILSLKARNAHRCWHKHSTFLEHLLGVHNILRLWGQGTTIGRVGLFHSAYSNSYVNLALYDPETERQIMRVLIGEDAEQLVYLFCIINRQAVVVESLLKTGRIPPQGLEVPHLREPNTTVYLNPETLRMLVVFTMADIADQYFGWQDELFGGGGNEGSMIIPNEDIASRHEPTALWPGVSKPGLWMSYVSQLAQVVRTFQPETGNNDDRSLHIPPVFENCTRILMVNDEARARDLYWSVITGEITSDENVISTLRSCSDKNPWAFEPLVILAQKLLHRNDHDGALEATSRALELQIQWGTAWDKRMSFAAWVAWTRVLHQRAEDRSTWPSNSWDVNNFGLVK